MPRPRRRRLARISLRMVFVLTTILCIWLGYEVHQVKKQKEAVAWVAGAGGSVVYGYETAIAPNLPGPDWLCNLIGVDYFATVEAVSGFPSDTMDISPLANLSNLEYLDLTNTQVRDLTPVAKLTKLRVLYLWDTRVTDLSPLAGLTTLEELYLDDTQVSDLSALENLTKLEALGLADTAVADVSAMAQLTSLRELDLRGTRVNKEDIATLQMVLPNCMISQWPD